MNAIQPLIDKASDLIKRADYLELKKPSIKSIPKFIRKVKAELNFLLALENRNVPPKDNQLQSTNLTHLETVLSAAESLPDVTDIFCHKHYTDDYEFKKTLGVDIISNNGAVWVKVTARKGHALHRIWEGEGDYGDKDIVEQALEYKKVASEHPIKFIVPQVHVIFFNGVTSAIQGELHSVGIATHGHVLDDADDHRNDTVPSFDWSVLKELKVVTENDPRQNKVNLDVTTMIALTSNLTHDGCWYSYPECNPINKQALEERQRPQLTCLYNFMKGKRLFACKTAVEGFKDNVNTVGGPTEQARAERLLSKVTVMDDCISTRTQEHIWSNKIKERSKIIFGTGDFYEMVTLSANASFVRSANKHNVLYAVEIHQSRAFTEQKEKEINSMAVDKKDLFSRITLEHILKDVLNPR
ncbi:UPF0415 protein C7orf25 homolog [Anneissia japonica]|uniref:UPF0415 protein C7orf25 homolog n=1 Tax=Anneissia japonica TaxID=1529436 RepID=UPI0014259F9B|nr:UPF0415 protein C7orf25 homolog [Anneissia japonica]XP_033107652.1 UPF0415 protein C7orf25 homolog [Anneissia japonica]